MEDSSNPVMVPPGLRGKPAVTDSFLTAARLIRRGWTEEGKKTDGRQFTHFDSTPCQRFVSRSDGHQDLKRVELCPKEPRIRRVVVVNSRKVDVEKETGSERKTDETKQKTGGDFSASRQAGGQTGLQSQTGVVCVWTSGCRTTCKQPKRFKAPLLPVITEM